MKDKLMIVTSSPGGRDTIYIGFTTREGDMLVLKKATMIVHYMRVGVPGLATQPDCADRLRHATGEGTVHIPICNVSAIVEADPTVWEEHLGISRG